MLRIRPKIIGSKCEPRRNGLLYLGALRELFVISLAVGLVLTTLWQASAAFRMHLSAKQPVASTELRSVLGLAIDQAQQNLIVLTWPGELRNISLETGFTSTRLVPNNLVSAVVSLENSTTVMLAEWAEEFQIHHRVDILRKDEILLSEEFIFATQSSASVFVSANGQIAILMTSDGNVVGWDLSESAPTRWDYKLGEISPECRLSPDGLRLLVAASVGKSFLCDARTGEERLDLTEFTNSCRTAAWSNDGASVAVGDETGELHIFETKSGTRIWHNRLNFEFARTVLFSNDSTRLAVGGFDNIIRVWDVTQPTKAPIELSGQQGVIRCFAFASSDETLFSGSLSGTIHEWSLADGQSFRRLR